MWPPYQYAPCRRLEDTTTALGPWASCMLHAIMLASLRFAVYTCRGWPEPWRRPGKRTTLRVLSPSSPLAPSAACSFRFGRAGPIATRHSQSLRKRRRVRARVWWEWSWYWESSRQRRTRWAPGPEEGKWMQMQATGFVRRSSMSVACVGRWSVRASALDRTKRTHGGYTHDAPDGSCRPTELCMPAWRRHTYVRLCVVAFPPGQAVAVARGNWDAWPGLICQSPDP